MKIKLKNFGVLKQAEFELGNMTIICGQNNTGKTYATYALFGFINFWKNSYALPIKDLPIETLLSEGIVRIEASKYLEKTGLYLKDASKKYSVPEILSKVFGSQENHFEDARFEISCPQVFNIKPPAFEMVFGSLERKLLKINLSDKGVIELALIGEKERGIESSPREIIVSMVNDAIKEMIFTSIIPDVFIASAERTGSAIFQNELDFTRSRLVDLLKDKATKLSPIKLLGAFSSSYPIPVIKNVDFIRALPGLLNKESFLVKEFPDILKGFSEIIGGDYKINKDGDLRFVPSSKRSTKLSLVESSSAVRSLLDIGFYLRHAAKKGDLLMVDEPELNLHPENQRKVARLFAQLVNAGLKIFMTTHSDYIIKELNTLIMLYNEAPHLKIIAKEEGYGSSEFLSIANIKVFIAEEDLVKIDGNQRKTRCQTLTPADINQELGIEAKSFDTTIDTMNRIQESIIWGGK